MSSEVEFLVKLRDGCAMVMDACETRLEALAPAGARQASAVLEVTFSVLQWREQKGDKLGEYETSDKKDNAGGGLQAWQSAYNILQKSEASIAKRYHGPQYGFAYWLFGERIFRQQLKKQG